MSASIVRAVSSSLPAKHPNSMSPSSLVSQIVELLLQKSSSPWGCDGAVVETICCAAATGAVGAGAGGVLFTILRQRCADSFVCVCVLVLVLVLGLCVEGFSHIITLSKRWP